MVTDGSCKSQVDRGCMATAVETIGGIATVGETVERSPTVPSIPRTPVGVAGGRNTHGA